MDVSLEIQLFQVSTAMHARGWRLAPRAYLDR